jgi:hypothetical protein
VRLLKGKKRSKPAKPKLREESKLRAQPSPGPKGNLNDLAPQSKMKRQEKRSILPMRLATDQEGALPKKVVRENPAIKGMPEVKDLKRSGLAREKVHRVFSVLSLTKFLGDRVYRSVGVVF